MKWEAPPQPAFEATASHCNGGDTTDALCDGLLPKKSDNGSIPRFTWWAHKGGAEWVAYKFAKPTTLSWADVYWFDDTGHGECRVPASWRLLYKDGNEWKPVKPAAGAEYGTARDTFNKVTFEPVTTTELRLEAALSEGVLGGDPGVAQWGRSRASEKHCSLPFRPNGAAECSHGRSEAQPVEARRAAHQGPSFHSAPTGRRTVATGGAKRNPWAAPADSLFFSPRRGEGASMPGTYSQILLHTVFSTKHREPWIASDLADRLYPYIGGIVRAEKGVLYDIGGVPDYVHMYLRWRPDESLSNLMRTVKARSSRRIHDTCSALAAFAWQEGYSAFSVSKSQEEAVKTYIAGQAAHHAKEDFRSELLRMLLRPRSRVR